MDDLLDYDDPKVKQLNEKIKQCVENQMITFTLTKDGKLVAIGHFAGGDDTIGHDQFSFCDWDDFIKHS